MTDRILNWGLLSTARINHSLIPPLRASERNQLSAVASRRQATADAYAREWKIPRALGSYDALLADPEIDVIYNPLPNSMHAEWSIRAMQAGKHVLCEKPIAMTLDEMDAMAKTSRETGRILAEAFMYRHHPQTRRAKEMVDQGMLGKLQLIKGVFTFNIAREDDIRLKEEMGGGSIWDVGCYPISYARTIAGAEPLQVFGTQITGQGGVDETFVGQMQFPNDVFAQFDCGFRSPSRSFVELVGTQGTLHIPVPFKPGEKEEMILTRNDRSESVKTKGQQLYLGEVEDMADAVLLDKPPHISLDDSRGNTAAILALLESARIGKPVTLQN